jgi:hypothetical protein
MRKLLLLMLVALVSCKQLEHIDNKDRWQTEFDKNTTYFIAATDSFLCNTHSGFWADRIDSLNTAGDSLYMLMYPADSLNPTQCPK